jgi:NAD(P)-dependent dehydrogenase (short-subunit alcohol dehydrogenase family)
MTEFDFSGETVASIGARRLGEAQDIADAVPFLASPLATDINGQVLGVDGSR